MASGEKPRIVGVIPARLESERLPGKVLRRLHGRAMLHHVYDAARACSLNAASRSGCDSAMSWCPGRG